jgi:membrane-bound lytic murein transglycosylase MltF
LDHVVVKDGDDTPAERPVPRPGPASAATVNGGVRSAARLVTVALLLLAFAFQGRPAAQEAAGEVLEEAAPSADSAAEGSLLPEVSKWTGDFDGMRERRTIRLLVPFSKTFYFIDKGGQQFGATYEAGRAFEDWINKKYKTKSLRIQIAFIPVSRDKLLSGLVDGIGDIAAGNLTITPEREELVDFADPLATGVKEVIVTGPAAPRLSSIEDLAGKEVFARASSSYYEHLRALSAGFEASGRPAIVLTALDEDLEDEDILEMVNAGLLPWAVVDNHKATIWAEVFDDIAVRADLIVNEGGEIAWAMRKNSPLLRQEVDEFTAKHKLGTVFGNTLKKKYLNATYAKRATSQAEMEKFALLSDIFRKYGQEYGFDHLMLAAQGYQESRLDQSARSPRGAVGVMQLLPSTASDPSIDIDDIHESPDNNVHAGAKYMRLLVDKYLDDPALDDKNRTLMAFAAYNAGPGNLRKFRRLAEQSGLDRNVWFHNVEHAAAKVVGRETVQYVSNIYKYYVAYRLATERSIDRAEAKDAVADSP